MDLKIWCGGVVLALVLTAPAVAQTRASGPREGEVESDPIQCWWRTGKTAVYVGERFTVVLTCGVIDAGRIRVVPKVTELEPATVQLTPFEVVSGTTHEDIRSAPWRYMQFEYVLRLVGEEFFGQDVNVPSLKVTYNVQSSEGGGTEGRDQTYVLPPLPIRVFSLVPRNETDIRDASRETFAAIEARRFRASTEMVASAVFLGFAVVLFGLAAVRAFGHYRGRVRVARTVPIGRVLGGGLRELSRLKSDVAREGWTPDLAGRALAVFRVAGAAALGRPIVQDLIDASEVAGRQGQMVLPAGLLRRKRAVVSASTTAEAIARGLAGRKGKAPDESTRALLGEFRDSLTAFDAARYARNGHLDSAVLDTALDNGTSALRRLRLATWRKGLWPAFAGATPKPSRGVRGGSAWSH